MGKKVCTLHQACGVNLLDCTHFGSRTLMSGIIYLHVIKFYMEAV